MHTSQSRGPLGEVVNKQVTWRVPWRLRRAGEKYRICERNTWTENGRHRVNRGTGTKEGHKQWFKEAKFSYKNKNLISKRWHVKEKAEKQRKGKVWEKSLQFHFSLLTFLKWKKWCQKQHSGVVSDYFIYYSSPSSCCSCLCIWISFPWRQYFRVKHKNLSNHEAAVKELLHVYKQECV